MTSVSRGERWRSTAKARHRAAKASRPSSEAGAREGVDALTSRLGAVMTKKRLSAVNAMRNVWLWCTAGATAQLTSNPAPRPTTASKKNSPATPTSGTGAASRSHTTRAKAQSR